MGSPRDIPSLSKGAAVQSFDGEQSSIPDEGNRPQQIKLKQMWAILVNPHDTAHFSMTVSSYKVPTSHHTPRKSL
jgi:hypothetical protein